MKADRAELLGDFARDNKNQMYATTLCILKNKHDAEDAIQNALLLAFEHLDDLRFTEKMKPWLMKILVRECYRILSQRRFDADIEELELPGADFTAEENSYIWDEVCAMSDNYRTVLIMYYKQDLSIKEIAHILEISEDNVKKRLSRARAKLKSILEENYEENRQTNKKEP